MKRILTLTIALFLTWSTQAQDFKKILGTWEIKSFKYGDHPNNNEYHTKFRKYKSYTTTHFTVIEVDAKTNVTTTSIFGNYEIKDGIYTEYILNVNRESAGMMGQKFSFTLDFEGADKMHSTGSFNGMKSSELWVRVPSSNLMQEMELQTPSNSIFTTAPTHPLYVIINGDKKIILRPSTKKESVLSFLPQDQITAIEVLKNDTAIKLYDEPGRHGVIIITIKEVKMETLIEQLKAKGIEVEI